MKERPIIFTGESIRAILEGRKTQTRLVIRPQPAFCEESLGFGGETVHVVVNRDGIFAAPCPYGQSGDRLWVRETWYCAGPKSSQNKRYVFYRADLPTAMPRWHSPIHMPRWASRLALEITKIRVERVQEISPSDCCYEGIAVNCSVCNGECGHLDQMPNLQKQVRADYRKLWDSINAKRGFGWDVNPFVWVIEFRRLTA